MIMKAPAKCHGGVALLISLFVFALLGFSSGSRSWSAQTQYDCYSLSKKKQTKKKQLVQQTHLWELHASILDAI